MVAAANQAKPRCEVLWVKSTLAIFTLAVESGLMVVGNLWNRELAIADSDAIEVVYSSTENNSMRVFDEKREIRRPCDAQWEWCEGPALTNTRGRIKYIGENVVVILKENDGLKFARVAFFVFH
jgi:hypothetical protein